MKAMRVHGAQGQPALVPASLAQPKPGSGDVLVRVRGAGVTPTELIWYTTTHTKQGEVRTGAVPGHEFSGEIAALGADVGGFQVGDDVYGMNDWFEDGATAEFCLTGPASIARKPASLTHEFAATVPIAALTAWQGLVDRAKLQTGDSVLIHGAAGAVGIFAVQLASLRGAQVTATASSRDADFLKSLGAGRVIDYQTSRFEDLVGKVEVVFDGVGGEVLRRSWAVLKPGGRLVTIAADSEGSLDERIKSAFFIVEPNQTQLADIAGLLDKGTLRTFVGATVPLEQASAAYEGSLPRRRTPGKVVVIVSQ